MQASSIPGSAPCQVPRRRAITTVSARPQREKTWVLTQGVVFRGDLPLGMRSEIRVRRQVRHPVQRSAEEQVSARCNPVCVFHCKQWVHKSLSRLWLGLAPEGEKRTAAAPEAMHSNKPCWASGATQHNADPEEAAQVHCR